MDASRLKEINVEIMLQLQERGIAVLSDTTVHGEHCLRVAIANHRTRRADLDTLVREVVRIGEEVHTGAASACATSQEHTFSTSASQRPESR